MTLLDAEYFFFGEILAKELAFILNSLLAY